MNSVRFDGGGPLTPARIDEILHQGSREDFVSLLALFMADPNGEAAEKLDQLFRGVNLEDPESEAREQYLAAHHLLAALRQYAPDAPRPGRGED